MSLSSDNKWLASGSKDKTLKIWDLENYHLIATFTGESTITACIWGPDNQEIIVGEESGRIHFLRIKFPKSRLFTLHSNKITTKKNL
ncbi:MAG: hypothetical protein IPH20_18090 [Bacteroidales bacterium]|nr:hypothetical protein [Bacteroidales bacterium]